MKIDMQPAPAFLPAGQRIYAIGDIHGCAGQLADLHKQIEADLRVRPVADATLLHLGDYIDKGANSAGVLDLLACGAPVAGVRQTVNLIGNHEKLLIDALGGGAGAIADWLWCGGRATLQSWDLDSARPDIWQAGIPAAHHAFLGGLRHMHRAGGYVFVHAGVRPGIALEAQAEADLTGIRQPFLASEADFGAVVVHGHTAALAPVVRANRIGVDTGAWAGGVLSCVVLEEEHCGFLSAGE